MKKICWQISNIAFCLFVAALVWWLMDYLDQKYVFSLVWVVYPLLFLTMMLNLGSFIRYCQAARRYNEASADCEVAINNLRMGKEKFDRCLEIQSNMVHHWKRGMESTHAEATEHFLTEVKYKCAEMQAVLERDYQSKHEK